MVIDNPDGLATFGDDGAMWKSEQSFTGSSGAPVSAVVMLVVAVAVTMVVVVVEMVAGHSHLIAHL